MVFYVRFCAAAVSGRLIPFASTAVSVLPQLHPTLSAVFSKNDRGTGLRRETQKAKHHLSHPSPASHPGNSVTAVLGLTKVVAAWYHLSTPLNRDFIRS